MSTLELKNIITEHLSHIEDVSFLNAIKTIIESKASLGTYELSDYQKNRIDLARLQLKKSKQLLTKIYKRKLTIKIEWSVDIEDHMIFLWASVFQKQKFRNVF